MRTILYDLVAHLCTLVLHGHGDSAITAKSRVHSSRVSVCVIIYTNLWLRYHISFANCVNWVEKVRYQHDNYIVVFLRDPLIKWHYNFPLFPMSIALIVLEVVLLEHQRWGIGQGALSECQWVEQYMYSTDYSVSLHNAAAFLFCCFHNCWKSVLSLNWAGSLKVDWPLRWSGYSHFSTDVSLRTDKYRSAESILTHYHTSMIYGLIQCSVQSIIGNWWKETCDAGYTFIIQSYWAVKHIQIALQIGVHSLSCIRGETPL